MAAVVTGMTVAIIAALTVLAVAIADHQSRSATCRHCRRIRHDATWPTYTCTNCKEATT